MKHCHLAVETISDCSQFRGHLDVKTVNGVESARSHRTIWAQLVLVL